MLYKDIPFVRFTLPLIAGILLRYAMPDMPLYIIFPLAVPVFVLLILATSKYRMSPLFGFLIYTAFIVAGYILYDSKYRGIKDFTAVPGSYTLRVDKTPVRRIKSIKVPASIVDNKQRPVAKIMIYFPPKSEISSVMPGELVEVWLNPQLISDYKTNDNFDYASYMLHRGYNYSSFAYTFRPTGIYSGRPTHKAIQIQSRLRKKYSAGIKNQRSLAIISALTLGYRDSLDEEIRVKFTGAGISHVMAVSGLHVGIILVIVSGILKIFRIRSRNISTFLLIVSVWLFALVSGLSPSVCRASMMLSFITLGRSLGRHINPVNSLFASAFILLVANPFILFSVSFQLSYSAVLAILLFYRRVDKLVNFSGLILQKIWSLVTITLLAQAGSLPFVLYHFRSVPLLSVFTNIFAIPLVFLIIISGILLLLTPTSIFLFDWLSYLVELETILLYSIADWISSIS